MSGIEKKYTNIFKQIHINKETNEQKIQHTVPLCLSICLFINQSIFLPVYLSIHLSIYLSVSIFKQTNTRTMVTSKPFPYRSVYCRCMAETIKTYLQRSYNIISLIYQYPVTLILVIICMTTTTTTSTIYYNSRNIMNKGNGNSKGNVNSTIKTSGTDSNNSDVISVITMFIIRIIVMMTEIS